MTFARNTFVLTAALLGLSLVAGAAQAASYQHIDRLALALQKQAGQLNHEFELHYRHAAHYPHLISDASKMYQLAAHIHEVAHHRGNVAHLKDDLQKLDALFHHLEGLVDHIEHDAYYGKGHIHGHTGHVRHEMHEMEDTLHHLKSDIESMYYSYYRRPVRVYSSRVSGHGGHGHGGHGHGGHVGGGHSGHGHGGITFSRGGFSIRIGH